MSDIEQIQADYDTARTQRDKALSELRKVGQPIFTPEAEEERRGEINGEYRSRISAVRERIQQTTATAEQELQSSGAADPLVKLNAETLARAAAMRGFIQEDAEHLAAGLMAERIRQAVTDGDKAGMALRWRYGNRAMQARFSAPGMSSDPGVTQLKDALTEAEDTLVDTNRRDRAQATIAEANRLEMRMTTSNFLERTYGRHAVPDRRSAQRKRGAPWHEKGAPGLCPSFNGLPNAHKPRLR